MTSFERFKARNQKRMEAQQKINSNFVFKSYPSTVLSNKEIKDDKEFFHEIKAAIVNLQEKDKAYIFTQLENQLKMGSVWSAKTLHWMIVEELITIKDVDWHKYLAYLCNIEVENTWGYFKGPEKNYINIKNEYNSSLESLQKPVLVLPENVLGFKDKIVIKERPWLVQEYDAISSPGLIYYSLRATTVSKEEIIDNVGKDVYIVRAKESITPITITPVEDETEENVFYVANNIDITVTTENSFFKSSNPSIKIKKRNATEVIFTLPFGVSEVEIQTKHNGDIVQEHYIVK